MPAPRRRPVRLAQPSYGCDLAVINDWADNNRVDKVYAIPCYTQAIQRLSSFPDVQGYSSAPDDIHDALLAALRQDLQRRRHGRRPRRAAARRPVGRRLLERAGRRARQRLGVLPSLGDRIGPGNAQSIPLPLLVLGALALLLLLAAGATWLARRIQARRMTPAPSPVRRP